MSALHPPEWCRREPFMGWAVLRGMNRALRPLAFLLVVLGAVLWSWTSQAGPSVESTNPAARIYLSWHAPYGLPGAASNLTLAAGDTTREDTLYLTCEPATDSPMLRALTANLMVHAPAGDTLAPFWQFAKGGKEPRNVRLRSTRDSTVKLAVPWSEGDGVGAIGYDYSGADGRMAVLVAVPSTRADTIRAGTRYLLGRLLFRRPPAGLAGIGRPACIEWSRAKLALTAGRDLVIERGDRFASWNSPGCAACQRFRGPLAPKTWMPRPRR